MTKLHDEDPSASLRIIDAHHHLWDLGSGIRYQWLVHMEPNWLGNYSAFMRSYLPPEYRRDTALHRVVGTVAIEAECDRAQQVPETEWLTKMHAAHGMPNAIVAHAWVDTPNAEEIVAAQSRFKLVRGIRTKPVCAAKPGESVRGQPRSMQDPKWVRGLSLLERYNLTLDFRLPWWHLEEGAEVAAQLPNLPMILNHTGYPWDRTPEALAIWRRGMQALARQPNVSCKISGLCVADRPWTLEENGPLILEAIDTFGVDRCMFASNFPVDGLKGSWDYLFTNYKRAVAHLPFDDQQKLFAGNANRIYRMGIDLNASQGNI